MSRREAWLSAICVFAVALAVRVIAAPSVAYPVPEDTAYYVDVSSNLVHGRGFVVDALWSYQTPPLILPRPAFEVWLPLPSLVFAPAMALFGEGFRVAQAVSVLVGSLVAVLAWRLGADVAEELALPAGRRRTLAIGAGLATAVLSAAVVFSVLPDSTGLFAALSLSACLLMTRIVRASRGAAAGHLPGGSLALLGAVLGLAALCRSEAVWLAAGWAFVAWLWAGGSRRHRIRLIAVPGVIAAIVFAPWVVRDLLVFGQPLPGQTLLNALSVRPTDIYAYTDQPTLQRYLAQGPAALLEMRVTGTLHNLVNVLLIPALPTGLLGLLALPRAIRLSALRPLLVASVLSFAAASLLFPVATTWGTFQHASLAIDVLLVVAALVGLDAVIARVGRLRGWTRPVAWLGPALAIAVAIPLLSVSVSTLASTSRTTDQRYAALPAALRAAGVDLDAGPIITDHPIWLARATGHGAIALPDEPPAAVARLARDFGAGYVVLLDEGDRWQDIIASAVAGSSCFTEVPLVAVVADTSMDAPGTAAAPRSPLALVRAFRVDCP